MQTTGVPFPATVFDPNAIHPAAQGGNHTFQAIFNTVARQMPEIPPFVHHAVEWFRKFHSYYSRYKLYHIQREARAAGTADQTAFYEGTIAILVDLSDVANGALNVAIVTKYAVDILGKYRALKDSLTELRDTFCWKVLDRNSYQLNNAIHPLSLAIFTCWNRGVTTLFLQTMKIAQCALMVIWRIFELSMILEDAYLFFNRNEQTRFVACTDLVVNWRSYSSLLSDELGRTLEEHHPLARELLTELGENNSNQLVHTLISRLRTGANSVKTFLSQDPNGVSSRIGFLPINSSGTVQRSKFRYSTLPRTRTISHRALRNLSI